MLDRKLQRAIFALGVVTLVSLTGATVMARGGGFHGGGGHRGGGAHRQPHPYHPSQHHVDHHAPRRDQHQALLAHRNHHHSSWHRGGWGPGFWGGAATGYGLGYAGWGGWGDDGGDTYVDNSTTINPVSNESDDDDSSSNDSSSGTNSDTPETVNNPYAAAGPNSISNFPVDDWSELGIVTYAGQYGSSQGQVVVRVVPGSAAANAGFVPGDVILSVNGQPTSSADLLDTALDNANGHLEAVVWDARTGRKSTLSGQFTPDPAAATQPATRDTVMQRQ